MGWILYNPAAYGSIKYQIKKSQLMGLFNYLYVYAII